MADRTAANAYGELMTAIAREGLRDSRINNLFEFTRDVLGNFDFSPDQAYADAALLQLHLIDREDYSPDNQMRPVSMRTAIRSAENVFKRDMKEAIRANDDQWYAHSVGHLVRLREVAEPLGIRVGVPPVHAFREAPRASRQTEVWETSPTTIYRPPARAARTQQAPAPAGGISLPVGGAAGGAILGGVIGGIGGALIGGGVGYLAGMLAESR